MAIGCFFLNMEGTQVDKKVIFSLPEHDDLSININDNELLKIRMGHSDKKYVLTLLPQYQFYTLKKEEKEKRKGSFTVIGGIILGREEEPNLYKDALTLFVDKIIDNRENSDEEIREEMEKIFHQYIEKPQIILDKKELEQRLSNKIKKLNNSGKFDKANEFLEKIKKIPKKLYDAHDKAEKLMKKQEFDKALKEFENAKRFAQELEEDDLVVMYKEKINLAKKIPDLMSKRDTLVEKAMEGLRTDKFGNAQKYFKEAADVSELLVDSRKAEEYSLKAKALAEYVKVEKKFK